MRWLAGLATVLAAALPGQEQEEAPGIPIHFRGFLPGTANPELEGEFELEFRLYRSPQGGEPIWREAQSVRVAKGVIDVQIGALHPIPIRLHEETFKWIGVSVNGSREVYPRYHVVNVVFASRQEVLLAGEERRKRNYVEKTGAQSKGARVVVDSATQEPTTWRRALDLARRGGGDLATYEDWYAALEKSSPEEVARRTDHYEWVLPWAYDTASHGRFNRYFRGRFEGCDYMDLSPDKEYVFRIARKLGDVEVQRD